VVLVGTTFFIVVVKSSLAKMLAKISKEKAAKKLNF